MLELAVKPRQELGKKARRVRSAGNIPAVLYGYGIQSIPVQVESHVFEHVLKEAGETSLITLTVEGSSKQTVLIYNVSYDALHDVPTHIDFYAVRMDRPIEADIPLVFSGESEAVRAFGGVLVKVTHELAIRALPKDLPHEITIDISSLKNFDDQIFVRDIVFPQGVESLVEQDQVLVLVEAPRTEAELAAMEQPVEPSLEDIEVVGEKKQDEEAEEDAETKEDKS